MTEEQIKKYLFDKGCPELVWRGGGQGLVKQWADFVSEVESGYGSNCLIHEYWNDLGVRELIHDVGLDLEVHALDHRFVAALTATDIKHCHSGRQTDYDFWNYGYPKNASGYFLEDIKRYVLGNS
jgi:hypothetical protein